MYILFLFPDKKKKKFKEGLGEIAVGMRQNVIPVFLRDEHFYFGEKENKRALRLLHPLNLSEKSEEYRRFLFTESFIQTIFLSSLFDHLSASVPSDLPQVYAVILTLPAMLNKKFFSDS